MMQHHHYLPTEDEDEDFFEATIRAFDESEDHGEMFNSKEKGPYRGRVRFKSEGMDGGNTLFNTGYSIESPR